MSRGDDMPVGGDGPSERDGTAAWLEAETADQQEAALDEQNQDSLDNADNEVQEDGEGLADGDDGEQGHFDTELWDPTAMTYGLVGMKSVGKVLSSLDKPVEMDHLKFLITRNLTAESDHEFERKERDRDRDRDRERGERRGKGRGSKFTRNVQDMGRTEILPGSQRGQWWRNVGVATLDVIVREGFSLHSRELWKVPPGHYVQQGGPCEVFVSGPAMGLQRMPVQPRGWVTVDATSVGGPKYLEQMSVPRWQVVFSSGASRGDIVVREGASLDSEEVAVLLRGTVVEQTGCHEVLEDGIVRMPVLFPEGTGCEPSSPSQPPKCHKGWVTCDATAQGGPRFFEPYHEAQPVPEAAEEVAGAGGDAVGSRDAGLPWTKSRTWRVVLQASEALQVAIISRADPYAPGSGKVPPEDIVVRWLRDGDLVEQVGHSKKVRGYMVMPVRLTASPKGEPLPDGVQVEGWVTRRMARDHADGAWFVEVGNNGEDRAERRRARREGGDHHHHNRRAERED